MRNDLSREQVNDLVYSYDDRAITDELYSFGSILLSNSQERVRQINSRSATVLTWASGILALLFSQVDVALRGVQLLIVLLGSASALVAVICSFMALRLRDGWCSPSDQDWFEKSALVNADELKRFHVRSLHEIRQSEDAMADQKGTLLFRGQQFLMVAAVLMAIGLIVKSLASFF